MLIESARCGCDTADSNIIFFEYPSQQQGRYDYEESEKHLGYGINETCNLRRCKNIYVVRILCSNATQYLKKFTRTAILSPLFILI